MEHDLSFNASPEYGTFKLLELPAELHKIIQASLDREDPIRLSIKGQNGEEAVLCTDNSTYIVRSVLLSNTILVVTADEEREGVVLRDEVHEILELTPGVGRLHKLSAILKGREYNGDDEDMDQDDEDQRIKITYEYARTNIQASDRELDRVLKDRHILNFNDELRPIKVEYLDNLLELILNVLVAFSYRRDSVPIENLTSALADDHEIPRAVSTQVMGWFGVLNDGKWAMNVDSVIKQAGLGILRKHQRDPIAESTLIETWKKAVGDTFEEYVALKLLEGNYLATESYSGGSASLVYFPASALPVDPVARFSDLFLARSRWRNEEIAPFLSDIAVDAKARDKLLLKYARAITGAGGISYAARAQYQG